MKKRIIGAFILMLLAALATGCFAEQKRVTYTVETYRSENVKDSEHSRSIEMLKLETSSKHGNEINIELNDKFDSMIEEYLGGEPNERAHLLIASSCFEKDGVLCAAVVAEPWQPAIRPLVTSSIYLDLDQDLLYTTDTYLEKIGIDKAELLETLSEKIAEYYGHGEYETDIENAFYTAGELFLVLQITDLDGVRAEFTAFYNYDKKSFHFYRDVAFQGFEYLEEYIEYCVKEDDVHDPADESTYIIEGERVIFTQYEGYEYPIGWETFLQAYERGDLGDIKISELAVGEAVLSVDVKHSEKSHKKYAVYITSVTAFEQTYTFEEPLYLLDSYMKAFWGGKYFNYFLFFHGYYGVGETVVFTSAGVAHLDTTVDGDVDSFEHSDDMITEFYLGNDGELGYTKTYRKYRRGDVDRKAGILRYCLGEDEFYREQGRVTNLSEGELGYFVEKTESVGEVHDIESYFRELHAAWRQDFAKMGLPEVETVDALIEYNRAHYMRGGDISASIEDDLATLLDISYGELKNSGFKLGYRVRSVFSLYNCNGVFLKYPSNLWSDDEIPNEAVPCNVIITNDKYTPYGLKVGMTGVEAKSLIPEWDDVIYAEREARYYTSCKKGNVTLFAGWSFGDIATLGEDFRETVKNEPVGVLCEIVLSASSERLLPEGVRIENETVYFDSLPASFDESFFTVVDLISSGKLTDMSIKRFVIGNGMIEVEIEPYSVEEFFSVECGIRSPSISAYGQGVTFEEPMSLYGNLSARAFDVDGHFFFTNYYYGFGTTYILSPEGVYKQYCNVEADPFVGDPNMMNKNDDGIPYYNVPVITFYLDKDGELRYGRRAAKYAGWHTVNAPLAFSVGGDELYLESGSVSFDGSAPILIPEERITFEEQFGRERIEEMFEEGSEYKDNYFLEEARQASTLDELWAINAKHFERFN